MKAIRTVPAEIVNPNYSSTQRRAVRAAGGVYETPMFLTLPVGEIVDDPDCWKLCIGAEAVMRAHDPECAAKVLAAMEGGERAKFLRNIRRMSNPEVKRQLSKSEQEWVDAMVEHYAKDIDALDSPKEKPAEVVAKKP